MCLGARYAPRERIFKPADPTSPSQHVAGKVDANPVHALQGPLGRLEGADTAIGVCRSVAGQAQRDVRPDALLRLPPQRAALASHPGAPTSGLGCPVRRRMRALRS